MDNLKPGATLVLASLIFAAGPRPGHPPAVARQQDAQAAAQAAWERYTFPGEEFAVELPGAPFAVEKKRLVRGTRDVLEKTHAFGLYGEGVVFRITSFDAPRSNETLEYFAEQFGLGSSGGGGGPGRDVNSGGFTGKEYEIKGSTHGRARVFRALNHAYVLEALSLDARSPSPGRFFDSFELSEHPAGKSAVALEYPGEFTPAPPEAGEAGGGNNLLLVRPQGADGRDPAPHAEGVPYKANEVTRRAVIVYKPEPGFTEEARQKGLSGTIRLRAVLSASGRVTGVVVVNGLPCGMTEEAVYAARQMLFFPAEKDGRA